MGSKNKTKANAYVAEAMDYFTQVIQGSRRTLTACNTKLKSEDVMHAVQALPSKDREAVEKFWGLKGGPNHSKKRLEQRDVAFAQMRSKAIESLRKMLTLDYFVIYDKKLEELANVIGQKVDRRGIDISNLECVRLLMAYYIYIDNGPKLSFESDPMSIATNLQPNLIFDEREILEQLHKEFSTYPDKSINIKLLISLFDMMEFKDRLTIQKSLGAEISSQTKNIFVLSPKGTMERLDIGDDDIPTVATSALVRAFKERVFPHGAWEVTDELILGNRKGKITLESFGDVLSREIRGNWSKIEKFKVGQRTLKTGSGIRKLDVYQIGGLEFTDPYEVMFLQVAESCI